MFSTLVLTMLCSRYHAMAVSSGYSPAASNIILHSIKSRKHSRSHSRSQQMIPCPSKWPRMAAFTRDMCPSIHSLIRSLRLCHCGRLGWKSETGGTHSLTHRIPRISVPPQNSPAAMAAAATTIVWYISIFQAQFVSRETIWAIVECRFQRHSD